MTPKEWRIENGFSLAAVAARLGLGGKNARATYRRWEAGMSRCPLEIVVAVEDLSEGRVTASDWARLRQSTGTAEAA